MSQKYKNKIAVITGSAGGLGKEFARRLLLEGASVCISDVNAGLGFETLNEFSDEFGRERVCFVKSDVTSMDDWEKLWSEATKFFKSDNIDLLVNNAGVMGEREGWKLCIDINLTGVLNGSTLAMSRMTSGVVVNVASILGLFCAQQPKGWAYNVSKNGVVMATRCMSSADSSVSIMCLCPSVAATPILKGCSEDEIKQMGKQVGGIMPADQVGDAFMKLLNEGKPGSVMCVWNNCPPYFIPDTSMALFILFTTCAMIFRFLPSPDVIKPWPHMFFCLVVLPLISVFGFGLLGATCWNFLL